MSEKMTLKQACDLLDCCGKDIISDRAWSFIKDHLAAYKAQMVDVAKLDKPARVDGATFGTGVPWSTVIGAAQRAYDVKPLTPEQIAKLREMFPPMLDPALPKDQ